MLKHSKQEKVPVKPYLQPFQSHNKCQSILVCLHRCHTIPVEFVLLWCQYLVSLKVQHTSLIYISRAWTHHLPRCKYIKKILICRLMYCDGLKGKFGLFSVSTYIIIIYILVLGKIFLYELYILHACVSLFLLLH